MSFTYCRNSFANDIVLGIASGSSAIIAVENCDKYFLDSPSSTSELTYKIQIFSESSGTAYVNRGKENDGDGAITGRFTSVITVQEVAG